LKEGRNDCADGIIANGNTNSKAEVLKLVKKWYLNEKVNDGLPQFGILMGDVNLDGKVNAIDASLVLQHDAKLITLTGDEFESGDLFKDGKLNAITASLILQLDARLIDKLPSSR